MTYENAWILRPTTRYLAKLDYVSTTVAAHIAHDAKRMIQGPRIQEGVMSSSWSEKKAQTIQTVSWKGCAAWHSARLYP